MDPLEATVDRIVEAVTEVNSRIALSPAGRAYSRLKDSLPKIPERRLPTPFGEIKTPDMTLPELAVLKLDDRRREAIKAAVAIDLSFAVSLIPFIGDLVADVIEDTYGEKLKETMTDGEFEAYMRNDKFGPSTIAAVRALAAGRP